MVPDSKNEERAFEIAKLDYARLGTQEQNLMDARWQIWLVFFAIIAGPASYAGVIGMQNARLLISLASFFITCLALVVKHSEMVLRYDIRKGLKAIAERYNYENHDSNYKKEKQKERKRWWYGWYKKGMAAAFIVTQIASALFITWSFATDGQSLLGIGEVIFQTILIAITCFCLF